MLRAVNDLVSPANDLINRVRKHLSDCYLVTDLIAKLVLTFGVMLIIGGLYLIMGVSGPQTTAAVNSFVSTVEWIPGIPLYLSSLANTSAPTIGLVSWIVGADLLLVGLGLWVRDRLAHLIAMGIFALAAFFQFIVVLYGGILGATASFFGLCVDAVLFYFLLSKFDAKIGLKKPLNVQAVTQA